MRRPVLIACVALGSVGCGRQALPVAPSVPAQPLPISVEAEAGSGEGDLMRRLNASGGSTIHLAPGQRRRLTFTTSAPAAEYALMVRYSNDDPGDTETLRLELDGVSLGSFRAQDTGDDG